MINLKNVYGPKMFDRKISYGNTQYIPFIASLLLDFILAWVILRLFRVTWDYAFIKIYGLILLFSLLEYIFSWIVDALNYRLTTKNALAAEMKHYLSIFHSQVDWNEIGTYDDLLLDAAFSPTLPTDLRVLAGINYGTVTNTMGVNPRFENRSYELFTEIAPDYINKGEE